VGGPDDGLASDPADGSADASADGARACGSGRAGGRGDVRDRVTVALVALLLVLVLLEAFLFPYHDPVFPWHRVPGYSGAIGLGFAIVVVLLSKALGEWFLQRPDTDD
jgi:hypothetical protein